MVILIIGKNVLFCLEYIHCSQNELWKLSKFRGFMKGIVRMYYCLNHDVKNIKELLELFV